MKIKWNKNFKRLYAQFYRRLYYEQNKNQIDSYNIKRNKEIYKYKYIKKYMKTNKDVILMYNHLRYLAAKDKKW